jgi:hypothetical protein
MGNLIPVLVEQCDVEDLLQFLIVVIPDIRIGPLWLEKGVTLFPYPDGMGFDTR